MESVNETPTTKKKRGRPRKTDTPNNSHLLPPSQLQNQHIVNAIDARMQKLFDEHNQHICVHMDENNQIEEFESMLNVVSTDLSDILTTIVQKIDQVKSLTKEITREELIKEIVRDELKKLQKDDCSEIEILKRELSDLKNKFSNIYESINRCEETSTEF